MASSSINQDETRIGFRSNENGIGINRQLPDKLLDCISQRNWTEFCDCIDDALAPIKNAAVAIRIIHFVSIILVAVLSIIQILVFEGIITLFKNCIRDYTIDIYGYRYWYTYCYDERNVLNYVPIFFIIEIPLVIILECCVRPRLFRSKRNEFIGTIQNICDTYSNNHSNLNFSFDCNQFQKRIIRFVEECSIIIKPVSTDPEIATPATAPSSENCTKKRLMELENIRSFLSEEEYAKKRQDILAQM